ncbi:MAG: NADPH-dependent 7-cyano-7-deazaguanine reductase QueF [Elusimicrobia bacterium CG1_02_37_114]|nr:MAG: NADPH-dependent 7-cyano-7-deazaguanine reductase QueF [Elusimicrobia bacterium CG1_02_37_114]PIV52292.1 MAG: NADPH-dependent 7-cyano-7-deazaguanine reductase QueF [Elusimicrobia bacterium CG02_land_8_20_14_3_00_37_13]PIZ12821.1 MAG: NADPH-dependent 7-cyano-7-deazaguanine reductase QueF [Elusimicrobia bacterium CG_4_10_14_0_8_um_filter_37_32]
MKYGEKAIKESKFELWDNPYKNRNYKVDITFPEFTCLCPRSGYPDFATVKITYIPRRYIVELKSVKLYLNKYRNQHISHESAINKIFSDIYKTLKPKFLEVTGDFNPRGNVKTTIRIDSETLKIHSL